MELLSDLLLLAVFLLFILFILGFLAPRRFLPGAEPKRRGAFLLYLGPCFVLFVLVGALQPDPLEEYLKDPSITYINLSGHFMDELPDTCAIFTELVELDLSDNDFAEVPAVVAGYTKLQVLDLTDNEIREIPEALQGLPQLEELRLGRNPIAVLPAWLARMEKLERLEVNNTNVAEIPAALRARMEQGTLTLVYDVTPAYTADFPSNTDDEALTQQDDEALVHEVDEGEAGSADDHTESFGEYAWRNLTGGGDLGHKRIFGDSEVYYDHPVTQADADALGEFMVNKGLFGEDSNGTVQLVANDDRTRFGVLMVTVLEAPEAVEEDIKSACLLYALEFGVVLGKGIAIDWHICNDQLDILATVSSDRVE